MALFKFILPAILSPSQVSITCHETSLEIFAASEQAQSDCPLCGHSSVKIHSKYTRYLADLPVSCYVVRVILKARKFVCSNPDCDRKIFTERFSSEIVPYCRRFNRITDLITKIGLALGGNKGSEICNTIGCRISPSTILRSIHRLDLTEPGETSGVIGVDDWAFKKGKSYGTIIVDLIRRKVIDLLPDREAGTLTAWLLKHPEVTTVSRDRASAYALGIRNGAPEAIQVADRFHLIVNLRDAFQKTLHKQSNILKECFKQFSNPGVTHHPSEKIKPAEKADSLFSGNVSSERQFKFEKVKELHKKGYKIKAIARHLNAGTKTIRKYIHLASLPGRQNPEISPTYTNFNHFESYLLEQYKPGVTYKALFQAIQNKGFNGKYTSFCERMNKIIKRDGYSSFPGLADGHLPKLKPVKIWSVSKLAFMALGDVDALKQKDREFLDFIYGKSSVIKNTVALALRFKKLFHSKSEGSLSLWLQEALMPVSELKWFAKGIMADYEAVNQAVISNISNGPVEGQVNKLKTIKRNMYGRAGFGLLKRMVLANST
jgi:transposase